MPETPIDATGLAALLRTRGPRPLLVGLTGSVAVGKTWLAEALTAALAPSVAHVSTDGFLFSNAELAARGLTLKKGFPESYDGAAMLAGFAALRAGGARIPVHSHVTYDIDPALSRRVGPADIVIVEGLGLSGVQGGRSARDELDALIYLDADVADIERWYTQRFLGLWRAGADDPTSFYHRFAGLDETQVETLAHRTWANINLPNLTEHIATARETADILLRKDAGHRLWLVRN